jgi:feruloyl esterase
MSPTRFGFAIILSLIVGTSAWLQKAGAADDKCSGAALNGLKVPDLTITSAAMVLAAKGTPEYCRGIGSIVTKGEGAGQGSAGFQISLPSSWNGKFLFVGGGGYDGSIIGVEAPENLKKGYAIVATDSGHAANPAARLNDASWAITAPGVPDEPKLADYFYRSRHLVAVATKKLVQSFYGSTIKHAYRSGCSNGGREAIKHAMDYPDDFDGIIAGNAWIDQAGNELWALRNAKALLNAWIAPSAYPAIEQAVLAQCDAIDGVADRLIQNPAKCGFNPDTLVPGVLNQAQANALKTYMSAVRDENGNVVFPGGSVAGIGDTSASPLKQGLAEQSVRFTDNLKAAGPPPYPAGPQPWGNLNDGSSGWTLAYGLMAYLGYRDPTVNLMGDLVIDGNGRARKEAVELLYSRVQAGRADDPSALGPYIKKDRKLLIFDGYADPTLDAYKKILFYKELAKLNGGYERTQRNVRMFMVPDMQHCFGGTGPNTFDSLAALENWVERGVAPDFLLASHSTGGSVDRTMPVCMFPRQAEYRGSGDVNDASNWSCPPNQKLLEVGPNGVAAGLQDSK